MNELASNALGQLYDMHTTDDIGNIGKIRTKIKTLENKGDVIKDNVLDFVYKSDMDFRSFYHIMNSTYLADDILDNCEDASDIFMSIMLSLTT